MDHLAHLVQLLVNFDFGLPQSFLAEVDRVREQRTAFADATGVASLLQIDAFGFEEAFEVLEQLVLFEWFHSNARLTYHRRGQVREQLQIQLWFVVPPPPRGLGGV